MTGWRDDGGSSVEEESKFEVESHESGIWDGDAGAVGVGWKKLGLTGWAQETEV